MTATRMPTSLMVFLCLSLLGAAVFVRYFRKAFASTSVVLKIDKTRALANAESLLIESGCNLDGYKRYVTFASDEEVGYYLQRKLGSAEFTNLIESSDICLYYWRIRFYKPLSQEEYVIGIDPAGKFDGFRHTVPDSLSGKKLSPEAAQCIAEEFVRSSGNEDPAAYELTSTSTDAKGNRVDHVFSWTKKMPARPDINEDITVRVQGDEVGYYEKYVRVPQDFAAAVQKERSLANLVTTIASICSFVLIGCAVAVLIVRIARRQFVAWRTGIWLGASAGAVIGLLTLNNKHLLASGYSTSEDWSVFVTGRILVLLAGLLLLGVQVFLTSSAGKTLEREISSSSGVAKLSGLKSTGSGALWANRCCGGYALALLLLGFHTAFYLIGSKFGVWLPATPTFSNALLAPVPSLSVIGSGLYAALSEESLFRLFCIPFFLRCTRSRIVAVCLPALIWGLAHSSYSVYPVYARVIEITFVGIVYGVLYLKYGFVTVVIAHFLVDAIASSLLLLGASPTSYAVTLALTAVLPALFTVVMSRIGTSITSGEIRESLSLQASAR